MPSECSSTYLSVNSAVLDMDLRAGVDAYLVSPSTVAPERVLACNERPRRNLLQRIESEGISKVLIRSQDQQKFDLYLNKHWEHLLAKEDLDAEQRLAILTEVTRSRIEQAMSPSESQSDISLLIDTTELLSQEICAQLAENPLPFAAVIRSLRNDQSLATHSTRVAVFCQVLAHGLGYGGKGISEIVQGALLQDLGMARIPEQHWKSACTLSVDDLQAIRRHPTIGFECLLSANNLGTGPLLMVYQHHERADGSGFPVGLGNSDHHPYAKIGAVADVFAAMTSNRNHRLSWSWPQAVDSVKSRLASKFDREVLECWLKIVE